MRIRLRVQMSGTRNGKEWPVRGSVMEVPDDEGAGYCAAGIAEPVTVFEKPETATVKTEPETGDAEEEQEPETATIKEKPEVRAGALSPENASALVPPPQQIHIPRRARGR